MGVQPAPPTRAFARRGDRNGALAKRILWDSLVKEQESGSGDLAKDKKVYFGDPLLRTITAERVGLPRDRHAEVENAVALALYRRWEVSGCSPASRRSIRIASRSSLER